MQIPLTMILNPPWSSIVSLIMPIFLKLALNIKFWLSYAGIGIWLCKTWMELVETQATSAI